MSTFYFLSSSNQMHINLNFSLESLNSCTSQQYMKPDAMLFSFPAKDGKLKILLEQSNSGTSFKNGSLTPTKATDCLDSALYKTFQVSRGTGWHFMGNTTHHDHFKLLQIDGENLLVGARNVIYNLSLPTLEENTKYRITWISKKEDRDLCLLKGKSENDCQNYIRVLAITNDSKLLVCGTNAYNPLCRYYKRFDDEFYTVEREFPGKGICPYDPQHNSTFIYADGELYSGTVADFSGSDSLILRDQLRTEQFDPKHLNGPNFVSSMEDKDHVYFFFREEAVEYMNCGKSIYSRVGRVCKNDRGGPQQFKNKWQSFLKTRLNCSIPGNLPFYFNEILSSVTVTRTSPVTESLIYAVFSSGENFIGASAICVFKLSDIRESFEEGPYKYQRESSSNWLPLPKLEIPEPRPGSCSSSHLSKVSYNFAKHHTLMDWAVQSPAPLFTQVSSSERLTALAVLQGVSKLQIPDILFVGSTSGKVLIINSKTSVLIQVLQVFEASDSIYSLLIHKESLILNSGTGVVSLNLYNCHKVTSCEHCFRDPLCFWKQGNCKRRDKDGKETTNWMSPCLPIPTTTTTTSTTTTTTSTTTTTQSTTPSTTTTSPSTTTTTSSTTNTYMPTKSNTISSNNEETLITLDNSCPICPPCIVNRTTKSIPSRPWTPKRSFSDSSSSFLSHFPFVQSDNKSVQLNRNEDNDRTEQNLIEHHRNDNMYPDHIILPKREAGEEWSSGTHTSTLALATIISSFLSLLIGFTLGFLLSKFWYTGTKSLFSSHGLNTINNNNNNNNYKCYFKRTIAIKPIMNHTVSDSGYTSPNGSVDGESSPKKDKKLKDFQDSEDLHSNSLRNTPLKVKRIYL